MENTDDRARWNEKYRRFPQHPPNERLAEYRHWLRPGLVLDLAGGLGQNAQLLSGSTAVVADISDEALARASGLRVLLNSPALPFAAESFDTILCINFFDPQVDFARLLKPHGTLFFETYTIGNEKYNPDFPARYAFEPSAIATLFAGLVTVLWKETDDGASVRGTLIASKE